MSKRGLAESFTPTPEMIALAEKLKMPQSFNLPKGYLSHSQIEMYLRCPRQYYFRYVCDEKRPPGISMMFGSSTHEALETTHHYIVDHDTPAPTEQVMSHFSDFFDKAMKDIDEKEWLTESATPGALKDSGLSLVRLYNNTVAPKVKPQVKIDINGGMVRSIEKKFEALIADVPVLGYIDLIDTNDPFTMSESELKMFEKHGKDVPEYMRTTIVDFKTKTKSGTQADVEGSIQLTLYSFVEKIPSVRYDQLLRQKTPQIKRLSALRQHQDYLWLQEIIRSVASAVSKGVFPPCDPTSWACSERWCGFYGMCRGKKHLQS